jgi:hypothetical protein
MSGRPAQAPALDALAEHCWRRLATATGDRSDPWRTPAIGTRSDPGVALRTVVLRSAEPESRALLLHTDARSAKAGELIRSPHLSWLFWDTQSQEQLRCEGQTTLHREDPLAEAQWRCLPTTSRANYRQPEAPGTPVDGRAAHPTHGDDDETAFHRFLVVRCQVENMDWLRLDRGGHHRAHLSWSAPQWRASWVAP